MIAHGDMRWQQLRISPEMSVRDVLARIDSSGAQFAVVTDGEDQLLGVVTDGNIRRALLAGAEMGTPVATVMNSAPRVVGPEVSAPAALLCMEQGEYSHLPVVSRDGKLLRVWSRKALAGTSPLSNPVVLMAGGLGTRLGELTKDCPKPMLHVGGRPILEIVLGHFREVGFKEFYISVNYLAEQITDYFGDGAKFGCHIRYLRETKRMGTAGALSLLPPQTEPILVANADILAQLNMRCLLMEHLAAGRAATLVAKRYSMQVPYGVVDTDEHGDMLGLREKPEFSFCVSAGMYAISPKALALVPKDSFFDMPDLFVKCIEQGMTPHVLETDGYWLDIGRVGDFERAQQGLF